MIDDKHNDALKTINSLLEPLHFHIDYAIGQNNILYVYDINKYIVDTKDNNGFSNICHASSATIDIDNMIRYLFNVKTFRCWNSETQDWNMTEMPNPYFNCNSLESAYIIKDLIA